MIRYFYLSTKRLIIFLVIISVSIPSCTYTKQNLPDVPLQNISIYKTYKNENGVGVAIDIFFEEKRLLEYFGADLFSYGILPVHIIVENNNSQPQLIEKGNIVLLVADHSPIRNESPSHTTMTKDKEVRDTVLAVNLIGVFLPGPSLLLMAATAPGISEQATVKANISTKALYDKIIYKGERHQGFLYFSLKDIITENGNIILQAKCKNITTENAYFFKFDINTREIKNRIDENKRVSGDQDK